MEFFKLHKADSDDTRHGDTIAPVQPGRYLSFWSGEFLDPDTEHAFRSDLGKKGKQREWGLMVVAMWLLADSIPIVLINAQTLGWGVPIQIFAGLRVCVAILSVLLIIAAWRQGPYRHLDRITLALVMVVQASVLIVLFNLPRLDAQSMITPLATLSAGFFFAPFGFRLRLLVSGMFALAVFYRFGLEAISGSPTASLLIYWTAAAFLMVGIASRMFRSHRRTVYIYRQTERDRIRQLRDAYTKAADANRLKTDFVASTAHDLRNPLNAVLGYSEIIDSQFYGPDQVDKYREAARDIHICAHQMLHQIENLLDAAVLEARPQKLHLEPVDLSATAASVIRQAIASNRRRRLTFTTDIAADLPPLIADQNAIHQILINLVTNAQKFTPDGGSISIAVETMPTEITIRVIDSGSGIPEHIQGQLTDRFAGGSGGGDARPASREPGWGLGLSIVDALTRAHGGRLTLTANHPRGTVASIHLPLPEQEQPAE